MAGNSLLKNLFTFLVDRLVTGLLVVAPVYLASLLLLAAMKHLMALMAPVAKLLPESVPAENLIALLIVLLICFFVGIAIRTSVGRATMNRLDRTLFQRIPGYSLAQSLTQRLAGGTHDESWDPALIEIEEALVPGFIIEELADGRFTVFVPSVPTPMAGAIYILTPERVHRLDIPFTQAITTITRWGAGAKDLVAAMEQGKKL